MGLLERLLGLGRNVLRSSAPTEVAEEVPSETEVEPAAGADDLFGDEFGDLMAGVGATPVSAEESAVAIREATIAELKKSLADLRPLGDRLAEIEKERMALEARVAEAREELAQTVEAQRAELAELENALATAERTKARLDDQLTRLRAKHKDRDRIATERWHEIRALKRERKALEAELKRERRSPVDLANESQQGAPQRASLASLFGPPTDDAPASGARRKARQRDAVQPRPK